MKDEKKKAKTQEEPAEEKNTGKEESPEQQDPADTIRELESQLKEEKEHVLRIAAEYDNYRKRSSKEREGLYAEAYADALKEILPVVDNLERAAGFSQGEEKPDPDKLAEGVSLIVAQFAETLKKIGVESFGKAGEAFDPNLHNAIMHEENPDLGEGVITEVFQHGYRKGDRIIRFAMVKVAN
ncbi:MAG: nucleotide exchange factor GrpE [Clostridia bacterium]|nr:nucleotide exchange factor GrpE [Clostridia bacterium]MBQ4290414.1 nucleotide exchange factor GrpE [Clostridia bacterium]